MSDLTQENASVPHAYAWRFRYAALTDGDRDATLKAFCNPATNGTSGATPHTRKAENVDPAASAVIAATTRPSRSPTILGGAHRVSTLEFLVLGSGSQIR